MLGLLEYSKKVFLAVLIIGATIVVPYLLYKTLPHLIPFLFAYFTALLLEPFSSWLCKRMKGKKTLAITITYFLFLAIIVLLNYLIISKIYVQFIGLVNFIQSNGLGMKTGFVDVLNHIQITLALLPTELADQFNQLILNTINGFTSINFVSLIGSYTISLSKAIPNVLFISLIYLISVYLFLFQLENIHRRFFSYFKDSSKKKVVYILGDLRRATSGFFTAQIILSTITFIISFVGLVILKVEYAAVIAFLIVLVDILPILGTGSVLMPWAIFSIYQGNGFLGISLIVLFVIITVVRRSIEPKIIGKRIGLDALTTLISVWIGFKVIGILGIFLFPLACILYRAMVKVGIIKTNFKI